MGSTAAAWQSLATDLDGLPGMVVVVDRGEAPSASCQEQRGLTRLTTELSLARGKGQHGSSLIGPKPPFAPQPRPAAVSSKAPTDGQGPHIVQVQTRSELPKPDRGGMGEAKKTSENLLCFPC